jgi:hypothetical protein
VGGNEIRDDQMDDDGAFGAPADIRWIARRQLIASIAALAVIVLGVGIAAMLPASSGRTQVAARSASGVQSPMMVSRDARFASAHKADLELP